MLVFASAEISQKRAYIIGKNNKKLRRLGLKDGDGLLNMEERFVSNMKPSCCILRYGRLQYTTNITIIARGVLPSSTLGWQWMNHVIMLSSVVAKWQWSTHMVNLAFLFSSQPREKQIYRRYEENMFITPPSTTGKEICSPRLPLHVIASGNCSCSC